MTKIRLLFKMGFVYHKAAFDPIIELFRQDKQYDVYFSLEEERLRRFCINVRYRTPLIAAWEGQGYRFTKEKRDFDIIIVLQTPFWYDPSAGPLLLDVRNFSGGKTTQLDAQDAPDTTSRKWSLDVNSTTATTNDPFPSVGLLIRFFFS